MAGNEQIECLRGSVAAGEFIFLGNRRSRVAGRWNRDRAPRLAAFVRACFSEHDSQSSERQVIRPGESYEGAEQAG